MMDHAFDRWPALARSSFVRPGRLKHRVAAGNSAGSIFWGVAYEAGHTHGVSSGNLGCVTISVARCRGVHSL